MFILNNKLDSISLSLLSIFAFYRVGPLYETEDLVDFKGVLLNAVIELRKSCWIFPISCLFPILFMCMKYRF